MIVALCIFGYIAMSLGFVLWDAMIGTGIDWENKYNDAPPLFLAAIFWWLAIPIVSLIKFIDFANDLKYHRIDRQEKENKIRIAAEREEEAIAEQIEEELRRRNK